ncbi:TIGR03757 family integrating conjugative element protein [Gallibacterium salpingitidis]|uniref:TIGR03757 family integrating conjugative element protein n=1 Tax=Gallibacterium salpingitidis TaxID=505341 RepID=UPI00266F6F55|nr:TIGR03757 family integrating conjugative element protein [Gallibacterium salpingitidis]WKS98653.1 TIGR03757 family integrating conjugative element protein [Gallibacterium salpingitidis]
MKKLVVSIVVCLCTNFASAIEAERQVTVYTSQNYSIQHAELANKIYYLDQVQQVEDKFAEQFPLGQQPEAALQQINQLRQSNEWLQLEQQLKFAYEGVSAAFTNGIRKIPAIQITGTDHKNYVLYGITDVSVALARYQQYKESAQ